MLDDLTLSKFETYLNIVMYEPIFIMVLCIASILMLLTLFYISTKLLDIIDLLKDIKTSTINGPATDRELAEYENQAEISKKSSKSALEALTIATGIVLGVACVIVGITLNDITGSVLMASGATVGIVSIVIPIFSYLKNKKN